MVRKGMGDRILTILVIGVLAICLLPVIQWGVVEANWPGGKEGCALSSGACWKVLAEKGRLIIFGRYPANELWRPVMAMVILAGAAGAASNPRLWRPQVLLPAVLAPVVFLILMGGGVFGLSPVRWTEWGGLPVTLMLAIFGVGFALPLAILLAVARQSSLPVVSGFASAYIELVRGVPLITLLFMTTFILPILLPDGWELNAMLRATIGIILFAAACLADVFRAGLEAIPKGQTEACSALGLTWTQKHLRVLLPQALAKVIAPSVNIFIGILKDTSLVAIISIGDLMMSSRQALSDPLWRTHFLEVYLAVAAIYFIMCFSIARWSMTLERQYTGHGSQA